MNSFYYKNDNEKKQQTRVCFQDKQLLQTVYCVPNSTPSVSHYLSLYSLCYLFVSLYDPDNFIVILSDLKRSSCLSILPSANSAMSPQMHATIPQMSTQALSV